MSRSPLAWLLGFLRPFLGQVALSVLLGVATVASGVALLGTSAYLIATAALQPSIAVLEVAIVGVRFFGISRAVFRYAERLASHAVNFRLLARLRVWFYRQIEPLAPARLGEMRSADLLARAIADIETLENFYVRAVAPPLVALLVTAGASGFTGLYAPRLGLILAVGLLLSGLGLPLLTFLLARAPGRAVIARRAGLHALVLDTLQGMPDLLAFGQSAAHQARIAAAGRALSQAQMRQARAGALGGALGSLLAGLTLCALLLAAIPLVGRQIDGVSLTVLALVTLAAFEAVTPLTQAAQHLESSLQAARRLMALVDATPAETSPAIPLPLAAGALHLQIRGLRFAYADGEPAALVDFDLDLPPGKRVALVGASGAGKTTVFNLLLRFWEPPAAAAAAGTITLNGQDITCYDPQDVRARTGVIAQTTYLFSGTLRENLLLANPAATPADIARALQQARLTDFVAALPQGLDTWVGDWGVQLSGGERQRLAIARVLLRDAPLLLFDEPTANLDAVAERSLLDTLLEVSAGRSLIYVTHRLVGLEGMDEILVLDAGRVIERGAPSDLLVHPGPFARLMQTRDF